jgi:hypothetical protein
MVEFKARRHRLEIPPMPNSDDPAVLKRALDQMKRLVQDEFNRLSTDFYDFKQATYNAGIIPLRGVSQIALTKNQYSMSATWELPDGQEITPTEVRVRILEISPNSWATYTYPRTSWSTAGLVPGTQYTLQVQLRAVFEATDSFVSTTRNCPSVPVLRVAESPIISKVFTTDAGVGPPIDNGTNDDNVIFVFPNTDGTPGAPSSSDCWWGYKFQYRTACAWADTAVSEAFAAGNVGNVTIDTGAVPFTTYPNALFRLAYREICNGTPQDWVYGEPFMAVDFSNADCLGISKSASLTTVPYSTATLFALPSACQDDGTWVQIVDALTDTEFLPNEPGFKCIEYIDNEWTLIADDTTNPAISNTIFQGLLSGSIAAIANFNAETDFTLSFEIKVPDNSLVLAGGTGAYTIIDIGGKIKAQMIQNTGSYSLQILVPRDGGGAYVFRADGLAYGQWVNFYYVHDVSEPNGRILYVDGDEVARSANAIANDFNGITGDVQINTVNDMQIRQIYAWDLAVGPDDIGSANQLYDSGVFGSTYANTPALINVTAGDVIFALSVNRSIGFQAAGSPSSFITGTATINTTWTQIGTGINYDTLGVSDGEMSLWATLVTGSGTFAINRANRVTAYVVVPGLETAGGTDVTQAWATVTQTKAAEGQGTLSHTPGAATGGAYRALHFFGGGGAAAVPYGLGQLAFSLQPNRALTLTNTNDVVNGYNAFSQIHAMPSYDAVSYQWVVTHPSLVSGGMGVYSVELVAD